MKRATGHPSRGTGHSGPPGDDAGSVAVPGVTALPGPLADQHPVLAQFPAVTVAQRVLVPVEVQHRGQDQQAAVQVDLGARLAVRAGLRRPVVVYLIAQELLVGHPAPGELRPGSAAPQRRASGAAAAGAGGWNAGSGRSAGGTTGSTSRVPEAPSRTVAVAGRGVGQIIGHIAFDSASRIRCPGPNTHDVTCSSSGIVPGAAAGPRPGREPASRSGSGRPARPPPVTSVTVPSGATSQSRANQCSGSASALPAISTTGKPRISTSSASTGESNIRQNASAPRWSTVSSPHQWPASAPAEGT